MANSILRNQEDRVDIVFEIYKYIFFDFMTNIYNAILLCSESK